MVEKHAIDLVGEYAGAGEASSDALALVTALETLNEELLTANRELRDELRRLEQLVHVDPLTGLGNRRHFESALGSEMRRATRAKRPLTLVIGDLDRFGKFNERHGRRAGDRLLAAVGRSLRRACRRGGDRVTRYGADAFAVMLPGLDAAAALSFTDVLRRDVAALHAATPPTLSIGASTFEARSLCSPNVLVRDAEEALRQARAAGGDRAAGRVCPG